MSTSDKAMNSATLELTQKIQLHFPKNISIDILKAWNGCKVEILTQRLNEIFSQAPEIETSADKFIFLKEFELTVPADYNHDKQLKIFAKENKKSFYFFNDEITDKNFSQVSNQLVPGKTYKVKIWTINERVSSEECLGHLKINKVILTGAQGNSLVYQEAKEELPVGKWTLSFDEKDKLYKDADGYHRVPYITRGSDGDYRFHLGNFEYDWNDVYCLMAFCDC